MAEIRIDERILKMNLMALFDIFTRLAQQPILMIAGQKI